MPSKREEALSYHSSGRPGKIEVVPTKPCFTSRELGLAYTPGVAEPCREIEKDKSEVFKFTAKGNLVGVVSNGTAVLGLGNIGPEAGKPVMEGKGILFKRFADIDVFDIELQTEKIEEIIKTVQLLEPTFGGINLEDIKAPECFKIEEELKKTMKIPVFHDDQHGTAIISCAALINAVEIIGKKIEDMKLVVVGAGAAGIACTKLYVSVGVRKENISMFDSKGHINKSRNDLNEYKKEFAQETVYNSLAEAMNGADAFLGFSKGGLVTKEMVKSMGANPIVFAMANPDPEISYSDAVSVRDDIIMATGRSDYPNQVNNVLGFPFIFRGALDVQATAINEEMKLAAVKALANLAKQEVPDVVINAYGGQDFSFGKEYIIPKPFDPRVLWHVAPAVAKAAMDSGVAKKPIENMDDYVLQLKERMGFSNQIMRAIVHKAQNHPQKIVYPEGENEKIIRAANSVFNSRIGTPILIGNKEIIEEKINEMGFNKSNYQIIDPNNSTKCKAYADEFYKIRQRKGIAYSEAKENMLNPNYYAAMMVHMGDADALIGGLSYRYSRTIKPALECIGMKEGKKVVAATHIVILNRRVIFFADTSVNIRPEAETIAEVAIDAAQLVKEFDITPKVGLISFSNFGSVKGELVSKVQKALSIVKEKCPDLLIDGDMQIDVALNKDLAEKEFPFSKIKGDANILVFPTLSSANSGYKLLENLTNATVIGPILMGMAKPIHVLQRSSSVEDIINMSAISVVESLKLKKQN